MRKKLLISSAVAAAVIFITVLAVKIIPDKNQIKTQLAGENLQTNTTASSEEVKTEKASLRGDFSIKVNSDTVYFKNADGSAAYPILYKESSYLPLRAIGELMGKNVNWDENSKTINISGSRTDKSQNTQNDNIGQKEITIQERPDFTIIIEDNKKEFYSASKERIYPILYNGSTYLPLRAIGEIMNNDVLWDSPTKTITLKSERGLTVTDADTFNSTPADKTSSENNTASITQNAQNNNQTTPKVSMEKAKKIALDHVKLKENEVTFIKEKTDYDYGKTIYEIEFYTSGKEYDFEIDSETGKILDYSYENKSIPPTPDSSSQNKITLEKAKNIALNHVSVKNPSEVTFKKQKTDYDDGIYIYEIEFIRNSDKTEHEFKIDAATGKILDYDYERIE